MRFMIIDHHSWYGFYLRVNKKLFPNTCDPSDCKFDHEDGWRCTCHWDRLLGEYKFNPGIGMSFFAVEIKTEIPYRNKSYKYNTSGAPKVKKKNIYLLFGVRKSSWSESQDATFRYTAICPKREKFTRGWCIFEMLWQLFLQCLWPGDSGLWVTKSDPRGHCQIDLSPQVNRNYLCRRTCHLV